MDILGFNYIRWLVDMNLISSVIMGVKRKVSSDLIADFVYPEFYVTWQTDPFGY